MYTEHKAGTAHLCYEVGIWLVSPGVSPPVHWPRARALPTLHGVKWSLQCLRAGAGDHPRVPGHGLPLLGDAGQLRRALPALHAAVLRPERNKHIKLHFAHIVIFIVLYYFGVLQHIFSIFDLFSPRSATMMMSQTVLKIAQTLSCHI